MGRGLGRGFSSLIPTESFDMQYDPTAKEDSKSSSLEELKLEDIQPDPDQPRRQFDEKELQSLADSIQAMGVIQPIVVIKNGRNMFRSKFDFKNSFCLLFLSLLIFEISLFKKIYFTPHTSLTYSLMVRSLEKYPRRAVLNSAFCVQMRGC